MQRLAGRGLVALALAAFASGCASAAPPTRWEAGGAPLAIPWARWDAGSGVEIRPDGQVLVDDEVVLVLDGAGRVYDPDHAPVAVVEESGRIVGTDDRVLGVVGTMHASFPGQPQAWLSVMPNGLVLRYDDEGERSAAGQWQGCHAGPHTAQACVLVTHLLLLEDELRRRQSGPGFGFGFGVVVVR